MATEWKAKMIDELIIRLPFYGFYETVFYKIADTTQINTDP